MEHTLKRLAPVFELCAEGKHVATVEQIGKGTWCRAFRPVEHEQIDNRVYLIVSDADQSKEILSMSSGVHIPQLKRVGTYRDAYVWQTVFYSRLTAKAKEAWRLYKLLRDTHEESMRAHQGKAFNDRTLNRHAWGYDAMYTTMDRVREAGEEDLAESLDSIASASTNYDNTFCFEFAPRNLGVGSDGGLILLDPIFDLKVIAAKREAAEKRRPRW